MLHTHRQVIVSLIRHLTRFRDRLSCFLDDGMEANPHDRRHYLSEGFCDTLYTGIAQIVDMHPRNRLDPNNQSELKDYSNQLKIDIIQYVLTKYGNYMFPLASPVEGISDRAFYYIVKEFIQYNTCEAVDRNSIRVYIRNRISLTDDIIMLLKEKLCNGNEKMIPCRLVKLSKDFADEFQCEAFVAVKGSELISKLDSGIKSLCQEVHDRCDEYAGICFGTNQYLTNFSEDEFSSHDISEDMYEQLKTVFGECSEGVITFGTGTRALIIGLR